MLTFVNMRKHAAATLDGGEIAAGDEPARVLISRPAC